MSTYGSVYEMLIGMGVSEDEACEIREKGSYKAVETACNLYHQAQARIEALEDERTIHRYEMETQCPEEIKRVSNANNAYFAMMEFDRTLHPIWRKKYCPDDPVETIWQEWCDAKNAAGWNDE